jgi:integrase
VQPTATAPHSDSTKRYRAFTPRPAPGVRFGPKPDLIQCLTNPMAHASLLCNRAEEYGHAGSSECYPRAQASAVRSMTTRQYARLVSEWIGSVGLDPRLFGTHSLRRTKATLIYRRTGNLRAVSTVGYLGIRPMTPWQ